MSARRTGTSRQYAPVVSRLDFPVLAEFLHAYLHEDYLAEYGSAEAARQVFLADASRDERHALADECARFSSLVTGQPVAIIRRILGHDFGSAWRPSRASDVTSLLDPDVIDPGRSRSRTR
jgi:hypothetical protein